MEGLHQNGKWKLNNSQAGFRAGMGYELNILRITEVLRSKIDNNN